MNDKDIKEWKQIPINLPTQKGRIVCYMPYIDDTLLEGVTAVWDGGDTNWKERRKHRWGGRVSRGNLNEIESDLIFKRFAIRNLRYLHKSYRARRTIRQEQAATRSGFNTAQIRCLIERRRWGIVVESALLFDAFENSVPVYHLLNNPELGVNNSREKRRALLCSLGKEVGRWHKDGFFHGDLHTGNMFVQVMDDGYEFYWIDNEEGKHYSSIPKWKRIFDLDHINRLDYNLSLTDRWRFWDAYCHTAGVTGNLKKEIAKKVISRTQKFRNKRGLD